MSRQFNIRYRWTLDDFLVLSQRYARLTRARCDTQVVYAIADALLLLGAIYCWWIGEWGLAIYFFALFLFLFSLTLVVVPWPRRRSFARQRLGDVDIDFHADENGFTTKSEVAEGTHKWAAIRQVDDLAEHVLLWPTNRMGWMIPKRTFASPEEAAAFIALAKEKTDGQTL